MGDATAAARLPNASSRCAAGASCAAGYGGRQGACSLTFSIYLNRLCCLLKSMIIMIRRAYTMICNSTACCTLTQQLLLHCFSAGW
jgi:hypothetical protein